MGAILAMVTSTLALRMPSVPVMQMPTFGGGSGPKKLLVIGGNGFVGREVCKNALQQGYAVTSLSRRGENPKPGDELLEQVTWRAGNALDKATIDSAVGDADAVVHCIGLLFDANSGLTWANTFTSASGSKPTEESTYDNITRKTALMVLDALKSRLVLPGSPPIPYAFVSCAEAGWPDVAFGDKVEATAPDWLQRYLVAKRAVEGAMGGADRIRPIIMRPSLIWDWKKFDVLPVIPVFNIASALGVPFVDKTVRVDTIGKAIVAGLVDAEVSGVQRYPEMESLASRS